MTQPPLVYFTSDSISHISCIERTCTSIYNYYQKKLSTIPPMFIYIFIYNINTTVKEMTGLPLGIGLIKAANRSNVQAQYIQFTIHAQKKRKRKQAYCRPFSQR